MADTDDDLYGVAQRDETGQRLKPARREVTSGGHIPIINRTTEIKARMEELGLDGDEPLKSEDAKPVEVKLRIYRRSDTGERWNQEAFYAHTSFRPHNLKRCLEFRIGAQLTPDERGSLDGAFNWESSLQGHEYWATLYRVSRRVNDEDVEWLNFYWLNVPVF